MKKNTILFIPKVNKREHKNFLNMLSEFNKIQQTLNLKHHGKKKK